MIAAGLLSLYLLTGGHGSFGTLIFAPNTESVLKSVVTDKTRADEAVGIVKQGRKDLDSIGKEASEIAKQFAKADAAHEVSLTQLQPFIESMSAAKARAQKQALDSVFTLRKTLTEAEWKAAFNAPK
jgi:hypothetical protein